MPTEQLDDARTEDFLAALTDALLAGNADPGALAAQHNVPRAQAESYARIISALQAALVPVQPSRRFVRLLRQNLIGPESTSVVASVRRLPPRVRLAAGLALLAGFALIVLRRGNFGSHRKAPEVAPAS
ncbi:MAG: hypothetical protein ACUVSX_01725 [Aggregatilineales bacterium]